MSTNNSVKSEEVEEMLELARTDVLPRCERRQFLEKSCWKLIKQLSHLLLPNGAKVGHPFEFRTTLDFYAFERCYTAWNSVRTLGSF